MPNGISISQGKQEEILDKALKLLLVSAGVGGVVYVANNWIKNKKADHVDDNVSTNPNYSAAIKFRQGINPSGESWLRKVDGSNPDMVYQAARTLTNWKECLNAYQNKYNASLVDHLLEDLEPEEYKRMESIVQFTLANPTDKGTQKPFPHLYDVGDRIKVKTGIYLKSKMTNKGDSNMNVNYEVHVKILSKHNLTVTYTNGTSIIQNWYKVEANHFLNPFYEYQGYILESEIDQ